ncbi:MAG: DUF4097 family beta strand repeat protein [Bacteroidales bacterium]|nr:DUF4097 family beta strand repeat protein [Bacteroidales bacterium]
MKALNCKISLTLLAVIIAGSSLFAQKVEKDLHKEFKTNKASVLTMDLKFCEFSAETWDKNQAVFDVLISVENKNEAKAQKMLDMIKVVIDQSGNEIRIETIIDKKFSKSNWGKSIKFKIKIDAKFPANINFDLENNFGSIFVSELSGIISIENNFGSLNIDRALGKEIELKLNHGSARFAKLGNASVELNFGDLKIKHASNLELELNSGECTIGTIENLSAVINMGNLEVDKVAATFNLVEIETNMSDVEIGIDHNAGFIFSGNMQMGNLEYPKLENLVNSKTNMNSSVKGTYGNGQSIINIEGSMGNFKMKLK